MGKRLNNKKKRDRVFNHTISGKLNGEFYETSEKCEAITGFF